MSSLSPLNEMTARWSNDITTDPLDPPRYEALSRVRPRDANPIAYAGLYAAEQQRRAYPDIGPLTVNATPQATYDAAYTVINKRKWLIVDPWMTLEEAGAYAKCRPRVISDAARRGELKLGSAGDSPRVRQSELDRWLTRQRPSKVVVFTPRGAARAAVAARRAAS